MQFFRKAFIFGYILTFCFCITSCAKNNYYPITKTAEQKPTSLVENVNQSEPDLQKTENLELEEITPISEEKQTENQTFFEKIMAKLKSIQPSNLKTENDSSLRVGMLLPLSGKAAETGKAMQNAAMLALLETGDKNMIVQFYDTQGTPEGATQALNTAIQQGTNLIVGPLFSAEVRAVKAELGFRNIDIITFSSDPSVLGNDVFSIALLVPQQVEKIITYACENGYKKFAVLAQSNEMGEFVISSAQNAAEKCGAEITKTGFYNPINTDMSGAVKAILPEAMLLKLEKERLREQGYEVQEEVIFDAEGNKIDENNIVFDFDAVLIADDGVRLRSLGALLAYYDVTPDKIKTLGISLWDDPNVRKEPALIGGWYPNLDKSGFYEFAEKYKAVYEGKNPPRIASQAYDAIALAAVLARKGDISDKAITDPSGFVGVDGLFRFLEDGNSERSLAIMQVTKKGPDKTISPAPTRFSIQNFNKEEIQNQNINSFEYGVWGENKADF